MDDTIGSNFSAVCAKNGGVVCNQCLKQETKIAVSGAVSCCTGQCNEQYALTYLRGDGNKTCAFHGGFNCGVGLFCKDDAWVATADTNTCCDTECIARVQLRGVFFRGLGNTTIERFATARFGVWYGPESNVAEIGKANYVEANPDAENHYHFTLLEKTRGFTIIKNTPSSFDVIPDG